MKTNTPPNNQVELLRAELAKAMQRLQEQNELLQKLTALPLEIMNVVEIRDTEVWVSRSGELTSVEKPDVKLELGDGVLINKDTFQIMRKIDGMATGGMFYVKSADAGHPIELETGMGTMSQVLGSKVPVEAGDRVILDRSGLVIVQNLGKRENRYLFSETLNVTWADVGGLNRAKQTLIEAVEHPIVHANLFKFFNKKPIKGVLLEGPPGNGKTLLAKALTSAIAHHYGKEARASGFIYCKGPEILSKFVSVAEETIRRLFAQAKEHFILYDYPGVIFIDEADAILNRRGSGISSDIERTIVPAFLAEMDGLSDSGALVILATNKPDVLDPAIVRDGRIDRRINVPRPNQEEAVEIFQIHLKSVPLDGMTLPTASQKATTELYSPKNLLMKIRNIVNKSEIPVTLGNIASGAMIAGVVERATSIAIADCIKNDVKKPKGLNFDHFKLAVHETLFSMANINFLDELDELIGTTPRKDLEFIKLKYATGTAS